MKWNIRRIACVVSQLICWLIAPIVFVSLQYSITPVTSATVGFKVGGIGIVVILAVVIIAKKLLLGRYIKKMRLKLANFETEIEIETDVAKISNIEQALKKCKTVESLTNFIIPFILLGSAIFICKALELAIVKLSGVLGFIFISYIAGEVFNLLEIATLSSKHKPKVIKEKKHYEKQ